MSELHFGWDEGKRRTNLFKHRIDFADAVWIWKDHRKQERPDEREDYGEERTQAIGMSHFRVLFVVYTERVRKDGQELIWIISARRATPRERRDYEGGTFHSGLAL